MRSISSNFLLRILLILVVLAFVALTVVQLSAYQSQKARRDFLAAEVTALADRNAALASRLEEAVDDDYLIRIAREKLDLHLPEEIVFYNDIQ